MATYSEVAKEIEINDPNHQLSIINYQFSIRIGTLNTCPLYKK